MIAYKSEMLFLFNCSLVKCLQDFGLLELILLEQDKTWNSFVSSKSG